MKRRSTTLAFLFAAATLAACQGSNTLTPSAGPDAGSPSAAHVSFPAPFADIASHIPDAASACKAPYAKIPGSYLSMVVGGGVKGSTFTGTGLWLMIKYTKGPKTTPTPSAGPTAKPTPKPIDIYYYTGTYTTKNTKETGCAYLFQTVNGKPLGKGQGNAFGVNGVQFVAKDVTITPTASGPMTQTLSGLSATGGHGSAILKTSKNKAYDTATITLTGRSEIKYP